MSAWGGWFQKLYLKRDLPAYLALYWGSMLRDLIGSGKPFLLFFLDHVWEAEVVPMVSWELRTVFLLRSEALSLSPEISQELWLKPPWTETYGCHPCARAAPVLTRLILFLDMFPRTLVGGYRHASLYCASLHCALQILCSFENWRFVTTLSRANALAPFFR